jgi:hypothetical protein
MRHAWPRGRPQRTPSSYRTPHVDQLDVFPRRDSEGPRCACRLLDAGVYVHASLPRTVRVPDGRPPHPPDASLMLVTVLSTLLLPLFVALFYFSNAAQRTSAMFICVVLSVGATIAGNGTQIALVVSPRSSYMRQDLSLLSSKDSITPSNSHPWTLRRSWCLRAY